MIRNVVEDGDPNDNIERAGAEWQFFRCRDQHVNPARHAIGGSHRPLQANRVFGEIEGEDFGTFQRQKYCRVVGSAAVIQDALPTQIPQLMIDVLQVKLRAPPGMQVTFSNGFWNDQVLSSL